MESFLNDTVVCESVNLSVSCNTSDYCNITSTEEGVTVPHSAPSIGLMVYYILTVLVALLGNGLTIITVWRRRKLHKASYFLVANLALKDCGYAFFTGTLVVPGFLANAWYFNHETCIFFGFVSTWLAFSELLLLLAISLDRYFAVVHSLRYQAIMSPKKVVAMLCFCWLYSFLWALMPVVGFGEYVFIKTLLFCQINWSTELIPRVYVVSLGACLFFPGSAAIIYCYVKIYKTARKVISFNHSAPNPEPSVSSKKATKTIALVTGIYFISWTPFVGIRLSRLYISNFDSIEVLTDIENVTVYTFSVANFINPFIYGIYNREFREELKKLFQK